MVKPKPAKKSTSIKHKNLGGSGGGAKMKILNTLAAHKVKFGQDSIEKKKLGALAKVPGSSTVRNALAKLTKDEWVVASKDTVEITELGIRHADVDDVEIPTSNEDYHETIKSELKKNEVKLFDQIRDGRVHSKTAVMQALGMQKKLNLAESVSGSRKKIHH